MRDFEIAQLILQIAQIYKSRPTMTLAKAQSGFKNQDMLFRVATAARLMRLRSFRFSHPMMIIAKMIE